MLAVAELQAARTYLAGRLDAYLADLEELVNIDSGTPDKAGNDRVGELLRARYARLGGEIDVHPRDDVGDISHISFAGSGRGSVLLLGHTDTVYPRGTVSQRPFRVVGDRAFGPGTADMKGGDLAIVYALEALFESGWNDFGRIYVIHNTDEEIGSPHSHDLIRQYSLEADAVLVLEAGRESGAIVSARKGIAGGEIVVRGVSAHAGVNHGLGRSAALELAHLIIALEALNGQVPDVTLNVGWVQAGGPVNVVPHTAAARLEMRATTVEGLQEIVRLVEDVVARRTVDGTDATVQLSIGHFPMHRSPANASLAKLAQLIASQLGFKVTDTATGGASDGNTAAAAGRPVLDGLGPIGNSAHSPNEQLLIPSVVPRCTLLAGLIAAVGSGRWDPAS